MHNVVGLVILILLAGLLVWSTRRALAIENRILKWGGASLTAVLAVGVSVAAAVTTAGLIRMQPPSAPIPKPKVAGTVERVQRGEAIATSFCAACNATSTDIVMAPPKGPGAKYGEYFLSGPASAW
jgi:hypothetical protein